MQVRRRRFLHLMPSAGAMLIGGCRDPESSGDEGGGTSGTGAGTRGPGTDGGAGPGTSSSDGDSTGQVDSTSGDADSSEAGSSGDTGEPIDCDVAWWMCGNFGPVDGELEVGAEELEVEGSLPPELSGLFVRNGPNPAAFPTSHWFLGDGMLHGVSLSRGQAAGYRARYIDTPVLGVEPGPPMGPPALPDHQANTSIVWHAGRLMALSEAGLPYEVSRDDLSTMGVFDYAGALAGPMTAHPKIDPATGEMVFFGYHILEPAAHIHFVNPAGTLTRSETVPLTSPTMMHEFQLTETHIVLLDFPIAFDIDLAIRGVGLPFRWQPDNGARIGVMPRNGTADDLVWFDTELGYVFHTFNAFHDPEAPERIFVDGIYYPETWVTGPDDFATDGTVVRFTIDTMRATVTRETIEATQMEFPQIDPRRRGLSYRYGYAVGVSKPPTGQLRAADTLYKLDLDGSPVAYALDGMVIDEVSFIPASPDAGEDEGWLVGYAYAPDADTSRLVVFDATDIPAGPVGSVILPRRVPHGFHGTWVPS